jgi:hypothetical protein
MTIESKFEKQIRKQDEPILGHKERWSLQKVNINREPNLPQESTVNQPIEKKVYDPKPKAVQLGAGYRIRR